MLYLSAHVVWQLFQTNQDSYTCNHVLYIEQRRWWVMREYCVPAMLQILVLSCINQMSTPTEMDWLLCSYIMSQMTCGEWLIQYAYPWTRIQGKTNQLRRDDMHLNENTVSWDICFHSANWRHWNRCSGKFNFIPLMYDMGCSSFAMVNNSRCI